jgi:hypothetical protein
VGFRAAYATLKIRFEIFSSKYTSRIQALWFGVFDNLDLFRISDLVLGAF